MTNIKTILSLDEKTLEELLAINPTEIYQEQFDALKAHGIDILKHVLNYLEKDDYNAICRMLYHPGDGISFINFIFSEKDNSDNIYNLMNALLHLKDKATKE